MRKGLRFRMLAVIVCALSACDCGDDTTDQFNVDENDDNNTVTDRSGEFAIAFVPSTAEAGVQEFDLPVTLTIEATADAPDLRDFDFVRLTELGRVAVVEPTIGGGTVEVRLSELAGELNDSGSIAVELELRCYEIERVTFSAQLFAARDSLDRRDPTPETAVSNVATFTMSCVETICRQAGDCPLRCGDGFITDGEECEGEDLQGLTCADYGFEEGDGLRCGATSCTINASNCGDPICGDGLVVEGEFCDGVGTLPQDFNTCDKISPNLEGELRCSDVCGVDDSACTYCGDFFAEGPEVCDFMDFRGEDCISLGFVAGELACSDDCSAMDTSGCIAVPPPCTQDWEHGVRYRCSGAPSLHAPTVCSYSATLNGSTQAVVTNQFCQNLGFFQTYPGTVDSSCALHPDGGGMCAAAEPGNLDLTAINGVSWFPNMAPDQARGADEPLIAAIDSAAGIGSYVLAFQDSATFDLVVQTLDLGGSILKTFPAVPGVLGELRELYTRLDGDTLHVTLLHETTDLVSRRTTLTTIQFDTATDMVSAVATVDVDDRLIAALIADIAVAHREDGSLRAYVREPGASAINVRDYGPATLSESVIGTMNLAGGSLLSFDAVHVRSRADVLVAQIDVAGVRTVRAFVLPDVPPAMLDVSAGMELLVADAVVEHAAAGVQMFVAAARDDAGNRVVIMNQPMP